jgi:plasmid replication initiation protein
MCIRDRNYRLLPFLLEIKSNFTEYQLHYLLSLNSAYAIKLYKLLYQYKKIKNRSFSVNELKKQFGLNDKYAEYKSFKQRVVDPSIKQINDLTDLTVEYREFKVGRKVEKLEFAFELKQTESSEIKTIKLAENINSSNYAFSAETGVDELSAETKNLISKYSQEKGDEYVEACVNYAKRNAKSNLDKYLADTLTKGWADLEIKKAETKKKNAVAKVKKVKLEDDKKKQEKEQENLAKSEIEHEWNKLLDTEKQNFIDYSNFIIKKHNSKLTSFTELDQKLPLSIFAVTNNKFYDRSLSLIHI